jgi:type II secretory pathway component GspD/PulD (secretin)
VVRLPGILAGIAGLGISGGAAEAAYLPQPQPATKSAQPSVPEPKFRIDLHDEVPLPQIIDLIRKDLGVQIIYADDLGDKKVYLPGPIEVPGDRVLYFLTLLLEQKGYTLVKNDLGIYLIVPTDNIKPQLGPQGESQASTQIIDTRGLKPSSLQSQMNLLGGLSQAVYNDDLGIILVTDSPGKIDLLRQLIDRLVQIRDSVQFIPFEVHNISAVTARDRILALAGEMAGLQGQSANPTPGVPQPGSKQPIQGVQQGGATVSQGTSNLSFQLLVDPQSNALLFRGRPEEKAYVEALLQIVDVPNKMKSVFYPVGVRAAEVISFQGSREGLGEVTTYQSTVDEGAQGGISGLQVPRPGFPTPGQPQQQQQNQATNNTAGFVIYPEAGGFMYHGTPEQHARIAVLAESLKQLSQGDLITMEFYKLKNAKASDVVEILGNLLGEEAGSANQGSILGGDLSRRSSQRSSRNQRDSRNPTNPNSQSTSDQTRRTGGSSSSGGLGAVGNDETSVIEDEKNNQVIVKTRQRLQPDFAKLIQRLDSRRPQVYVNAQIVAVTDNQMNRLAVETQIVAGQFGLNTNFGLSSFGTMGGFQDPKTVATNLPAFTAALIRSDSVPFIITALQNNTDSRILATPQLLVDDNESASVVSENEVPTSVTRTPVSGDTITSVGDPARAGTSLDVTPQISENAVKLDISIEQSSFTGEATADLPPPTQRNTLASLVTVPRDCTIVIGGLTLESDTKTVVKVPLLGDIPLAGLLFRDTVTRKQRATLYVFLTPTIMADPNFADVRLLTRGPAADVELESDRLMPPPELKPMKIGSPILPGPPPAEPPEERAPAPPSLPGPVDIHAVPAEEKGPMATKSPA